MDICIDPIDVSAAGHDMFSLIASRALSIEHLEGSSTDGDMGLHWLYALPVLVNLQHLSWHMAANTFAMPSRLSCSLPPNLKSFHLTVQATVWQQRDPLQLSHLASTPVGRAVTDLHVQLPTTRAIVSLESQESGFLHLSHLDVGCYKISDHLSASCLTHLSLALCGGFAWQECFGTITSLTDVSITIVEDPAAGRGSLTFWDKGIPNLGASLFANIKRLYIDVPVLKESGMFKGLKPGVLQDLRFRVYYSRVSCFCLDHLKDTPGYGWSIDFDKSSEVSIQVVGRAS